MTEEKWLATLSTTEPYNNIGLIKLRRNNENSEVMIVRLTKNSKLYDLTALKVFFVTHFSGKDGLKIPIQKEAKVIDAKDGIFEFIFDEDCMQKVGRQEAYFEIYDYDKFLDATQNFTYEIISSSRSMKANFTPYIETWQEAEEMLKEGTAKNLSDRIEKLNLEKVSNQDLKSHTDNKLNPHNVTAGQTGAYTKKETDDKLDKKREKDVPITENDISDSLKNIIAGDGKVDATVSDKSIGPSKLIIMESVNLFNKLGTIVNKYVAWDDGTFRDNPNYDVSNRLFIDVNKDVAFSFSGQLSFRDFNDKHISGLNILGSNETYILKAKDIPKNARYMYASVKKDVNDLSKVMVNIGSQLKPHEDFNEVIIEKYIKNLDGDKVLKDKSVGPKTLEIMEPANYADTEEFIDGMYAQYTNGVPAPNSRYVYLERRVKVKAGEIWTVSQDVQIPFYDKNGMFVEGMTGRGVSEPRTFTIPNNPEIAEMVVNALKEGLSTLQLNRGSQLEPYTDPKVQRVKNEYLPKRKELEKLSFLLPKKVYAPIGREFNLYNLNIIESNKNDFDFWYKTNTFKQYDDRLSLAPVNTGVYPVVAELYSYSDLILSQKFDVVVRNKRTTSITGLWAGDSNVRANGLGLRTKEMKRYFGDMLMLLGKMGSDGNFFEGRGGWTAGKYRTKADYTDSLTGITHPNYFYDEVKQDFDILTYLKNTNQQELDLFVFSSGTNEVFSAKTDAEMIRLTNKGISDYRYIVDNVQSAGIRVALTLTIPPNFYQQKFGERDDNQTQWRYRKNNFYWNKALIEEFEGKVDLIPIFLGVDTKTDFTDAIHLKVSTSEEIETGKLVGFEKCAIQEIGYLNSI